MNLASTTSSCEDIAICCYMVSLPVSVMPASAFGGSSFVGSTTSPHLPHQERSKSPPEKEKEKKREKRREEAHYTILYTHLYFKVAPCISNIEFSYYSFHMLVGFFTLHKLARIFRRRAFSNA